MSNDDFAHIADPAGYAPNDLRHAILSDVPICDSIFVTLVAQKASVCPAPCSAGISKFEVNENIAFF
jgi:hypothetical protein